MLAMNFGRDCRMGDAGASLWGVCPGCVAGPCCAMLNDDGMFSSGGRL